MPSAKPEPGVPLRDPEVRRFVRRSMVVEIATQSARSTPFLTPLWFVRSGDAFYLTTAPESRAGRNVAVRPDVTLLFYGERNGKSRRVLRVRGTATRHRGLPSWGVLARIAAKYYVGRRALPLELRNRRRWRLRQQYYREGKGGFGYLRVAPVAAEVLARP